MEPVNEITKDCFNAIDHLRAAEASVQPEAFQVRLRGYIDDLKRRAPEAGFQERDADDMAYAIVALADEIARGKPDAIGAYWQGNSLQLHYFQETNAGEGFFSRLQALRGDSRRVDVLRIYYLCLLFGFQGRHSMRGGEIEILKLLDGLKAELERSIEFPEVLSPSAERPAEALAKTGGSNPLLWVSLGFLALSIAAFVTMRLVLDADVTDAARAMGALAAPGR